MQPVWPFIALCYSSIQRLMTRKSSALKNKVDHRCCLPSRCNAFEGIIVLLAPKRGSTVVLIFEIPLVYWNQSAGHFVQEVLLKSKKLLLVPNVSFGHQINPLWIKATTGNHLCLYWHFQLLTGAITPIIPPFFHPPPLSLILNDVNYIIINPICKRSLFYLYTYLYTFDLLEEVSPLLHGHWSHHV